MRLWVHRIWLQTNRQNVLQTCGPREDRRFEEFVKRVPEELAAAYAWYLYVNSDPPAYHLEPVKHVEKYSWNGEPRTREREDTASITRFPLSAFLAVVDGYEVKALLDYEKLVAYNEEKKKRQANDEKFDEDLLRLHMGVDISSWRSCLDAMRHPSKQLKAKWGEEEDDF